MSIDKNLIDWLLDSDVSIQYQVHKYLLDSSQKKLDDLQTRIAKEGWGKEYLALQNDDGHWGLAFYQPKWTSTNYSLLDLRNLEISKEIESIQYIIKKLLSSVKGPDGGINPSGSVKHSDVCINGMFLNYGCYFGAEEKELESIVDFILSQVMKDGGFNCQLNRSGAKHSSMHTTISAIEGIAEYRKNGYVYRLDELIKAEKSSKEFLLQHKLFLSDRTGEIINKKFLQISWPHRWYYNILRALIYFLDSGFEYDERMSDAIEYLKSKMTKNNRWKLMANHPGKRHIDMESPGKESRIITLKMLRILNKYG